MRALKSMRSSWLVGVPVLAAAVLSACVVVPMDPKTGRPYESAPPVVPVVVVQQSAPSAHAGAASPAGPQWNAVNVRMYPTNEQARSAGIVQAVVMDGGAGRGSFSMNYLGQSLQGEASRVDRNYPGFGQLIAQVHGSGGNWSQAAGQRGIANAASSAVSMRCEYLFTAVGQGTGACMLSDGARYQMHFGG